MTLSIQPIHPFPARMAPEIAFEEASSLPHPSLILDPMVGSGTVMRIISEQGHSGVAFDMDPLSVLMTRVWTSPISTELLRKAGERVIADASALVGDHLVLPWIDDDQETKAFVDFWFAKTQQYDLRRLSFVLQNHQGSIGDALRIALSRLIITKNGGASLARDVSHGRPHRVRQTNDFPVMSEFRRSVSFVASRLENQPPPGNVMVAQGDARRLEGVTTASIDAIITSPPYLNAIDYVRGHKLSLVWLGHRIRDLRRIRQESIGTERGLNAGTNEVIHAVYHDMPQLSRLPRPKQRTINRYIIDMTAVLGEFARVLKPGGKAVLVVGNSCVSGVFIENTRIVTLVARQHGFALSQSRERELPPNRRYLPPPSGRGVAALERRMRTETVLTLIRS